MLLKSIERGTLNERYSCCRAASSSSQSESDARLSNKFGNKYTDQVHGVHALLLFLLLKCRRSRLWLCESVNIYTFIARTISFTNAMTVSIGCACTTEMQLHYSNFAADLSLSRHVYAGGIVIIIISIIIPRASYAW